MKKQQYLIAAIVLGVVGFWQSLCGASGKLPENVPTSLHAISVTDVSGNAQLLGQYKGKVLLIVNVASKCGFTPQYEGLEALYREFKDQGLVILGFPANNFMGQEPGTDAEIQTFCQTTYGVTFPVFSKVSVAGKDIHPLFQYLTTAPGNPGLAGRVTWNFNKFLVGREGQLINRFGSKVTPDDATFRAAIVDALQIEK